MFTGRCSICKHFSQIGVAFKHSPRCPPQSLEPQHSCLPPAPAGKAQLGAAQSCPRFRAARGLGRRRPAVARPQLALPGWLRVAAACSSGLLWPPAPSLPAQLLAAGAARSCRPPPSWRAGWGCPPPSQRSGQGRHPPPSPHGSRLPEPAAAPSSLPPHVAPASCSHLLPPHLVTQRSCGTAPPLRLTLPGWQILQLRTLYKAHRTIGLISGFGPKF